MASFLSDPNYSVPDLKDIKIGEDGTTVTPSTDADKAKYMSKQWVITPDTKMPAGKTGALSGTQEDSYNTIKNLDTESTPNFKGTAGGYTDTVEPAKSTFSPEDTMAAQLAKLTSKDNPLARQAEARALEGMNKLGLSNSTMAIGASEGARLREMKDVARTDNEGALQTSLQELRGEQELAGIKEKGAQDINQISFKSEIDDYFNKYNWDSKFKEMLLQEDIDTRITDLTNGWAATLMEKQLSSEERRTVSASLGAVMNNYFNGVISVQNNTNLTPKKQKEAVEDLYESFVNGGNTLLSIFGYKMDLDI